MQYARRLIPFRVKQKIKSIQHSSLWQSFKQFLFELQMSYSFLTRKARFREVSQKINLRLNLGCGSDVRPKWINIDMVKPSNIKIPDESKFIAYDLRRGIPLPDQSCDYIYSSHFWEHMDYYTGYNLMLDSYRVLKSGGIFRIALPNFEADFRAYVQKDESFFDVIPDASLENIQGAESLIDYLHYAVYQYGEHQCLYDIDRTCKMLQTAGFISIREVEFDATVDINDPLRTKYSFYIEAVRE